MSATSLRDAVAFITGASAGIGAATARLLAREGARVVLTARRSERLDALAGELGDRAHAVALDVTDPAAIARVVAALPPPFDAVRILVNAAGLALGLGPAHDASLDDWDRMIDTNVRGLVHLTRAFLPGMIARRGGHVVNLGSVAGSYPYPGGNVYGGTKAFVEQFSQNLRSDLLGHPVRVTNIEPGMVETEFSAVRFGGDQARADAVYRGMTPLTAEDIADVVLYAVTRPAHVNVNRIEVMPVEQAFGPFAVHRRS